MTKSEYQELVEFLAGKFERIDERFEQIDRRFDAIEARLSGVEVSVEQNRHYIQLVAEGVANVNERLDAFRAEVAERFDEVSALFKRQAEWVRGLYGEVKRRVEAVEVRVDRLETAGG